MVSVGAKTNQNSSAGHLQILVDGLANLFPHPLLPGSLGLIGIFDFLLPLGEILLLCEVNFTSECLQAQVQIVNGLIVR